MLVEIIAAAALAFVDPATYVENVYGTAAPGAMVLVWDGDRAICSTNADADGNFLISSIPTPYDGREYTIESAGTRVTAQVLPGASMALEVNFRGGATWKYRHERQTAFAAPGRLAPQNYTRSIFATREGLVGGTTANGHVIVTSDHFAALPSRRALSTNFGHEREVRLTYRGKTITAPVWDVGPWNTRDDYWNPTIIRESFQDLPRGLPESEAAYTSGYNGGLDSRGRKVLNPAGIDLADGTFLLDLSLTNNDRVTVEYLWLDETGPLTSTVTAAANATGFVIDAVSSDAGTGNSPITAAEMYVDEIGEAGSGVRLDAVDGAFDGVTESIRGTLDALPGIHIIYVHARDAYGNWGPVTATSVAMPGNVSRRRSVRH